MEMNGTLTSSDEDAFIFEEKKKKNIYIIVCISVVLIAIFLILLFTVILKPSDITFIAMNDIHIDPLYLENGDPMDNCRSVNTKKPDIKYKYGIYGCNIPLVTYSSALSYMKKNIKKPNFIVFGGDSIAHKLPYNLSQVASSFENYLQMLSDTYPGVPIYSVLGNNEFSPDYGNFSTDPITFETYSQILSKWLSNDQIATFKKGGYYYQDFPSQKTRILFMNTVMYTINRDNTTSDPWDQFSWIESMCQEAKTKKYKVGVIYHVGTGISSTNLSVGWKDSYLQRYEKIISNYDIRFHIVGHSHLDLMMPVSSSNDGQYFYQQSMPSLTTSHGNNPAFRVYKLKGGEIKDYYQYYGDLIMNPDDIDWKLEYQFSKVYKQKNLNPESMRNAVNFAQSTGEGMWRYLEFTGARAEKKLTFYYCILQTVSSDEVQKCLDLLEPSELLSIAQPGEKFILKKQLVEGL